MQNVLITKTMNTAKAFAGYKKRSSSAGLHQGGNLVALRIAGAKN